MSAFQAALYARVSSDQQAQVQTIQSQPASCRSGRQGHKSSEVQVLVPSIARFGRLAYPLLGEVTSRDMRGSKSDGCPVRSTAVGAIWVASKPRGLKVIE
jgi:hypothetical protein